MPDSEPGELTPKEIYQEAVKLDRSGEKEDAARRYQEAGYYPQAIRIYEELGEITKAYEVAMANGDHYSADRLASLHRIPNHEFLSFPPARGRDFIEVISEALVSRLRANATAEKLGFHGFIDKVVVDVGTRDERYVPLIRTLGAKEVFGVDPDKKEIEKAVHSGILDKEHVIPKPLEEIPDNLKGKFDVAAVFNFNPPLSGNEEFMEALNDSLSPNGEVVITFAEREVLQATMPSIRRHFDSKSTQLWKGKSDMPHKYLVVATKKH